MAAGGCKVAVEASININEVFKLMLIAAGKQPSLIYSLRFAFSHRIALLAGNSEIKRH
jgi:hypothetical protein